MTEHQPAYRVAEVFGPTIQGEGAMQGAVTHFIRFGGCDYRCLWCDSMHAVKPDLVAQLPKLTVSEIVERILALPPSPWVTFSGGNPALHDLTPLVDALHGFGYKVNVETQGTVVHGDWLAWVDQLTISPKPPSAGNITSVARLKAFFEKVQLVHLSKVCLKVVVFDDQDFEYARVIHEHFPQFTMFVQVGNPDPPAEEAGWDNPADVSDLLDRLKWLSDKVLADPSMQDVRVCPQMHVLIWNNERGR